MQLAEENNTKTNALGKAYQFNLRRISFLKIFLVYNVLILTHIEWPCTCEPKGINRFSLRQNLRLLLTLFESKPHIIIIFHLKTNRQKTRRI